MDILDVVVHYETTMVELDSCDADYISLITLLHTMFERKKKKTSSEEVSNDKYRVWVFWPWFSERKEVTSDRELLNVFRSFIDRKIKFKIERKPYILFPQESISNIFNPLPRAYTGNSNLGFSDFANNLFNYKGDKEVDGANSVAGNEELVEVDGNTVEGGVNEDEHEVGDGSDKVSDVDNGLELAVVDEDDINVNLELLEGYQSKSDDEYFSESEDEKVKPKIA
ncbi:hypothetical protein EZV62_018375 [Acer yangbiense]|uniref:Uncharacterized protein n=1 Tax=Acer yangbiense TaxID=1000413 RepID=A0A5C7HL50_9ROSI|nr:hypothetical protein EZV62_018375 [Acer yangbiense]